jgi:hypothetical protein
MKKMKTGTMNALIRRDMSRKRDSNRKTRFMMRKILSRRNKPGKIRMKGRKKMRMM